MLGWTLEPTTYEQSNNGQRLSSGTARSYLAFMQQVETETIVVGAGIIGLAIALDLAEQGQVVHVVDREPSWGAEASGAAAGMLAPQHETDEEGPFLDLCLEARNLWIPTAQKLAESTGIDPGHRTDGLLHLAFDDDEWSRFCDRSRWQSESGLPVEKLTLEQTAERFPMVSRSIAGALFYEGDHQLHTGRTLEAFAAACGGAGVHFLYGHAVQNLIVDRGSNGQRVTGVRTSQITITARRTVLATGAWTGEISARSGISLPVEPVRGQLAVARLESGLPPCLVSSSSGYLVPRDGHELLAGATSEHVGFDRSTTEEGIFAVWQGAVRMLPGLGERRPDQQWAGLRPFSPDALPILGPVPGKHDLWIASAHYRNGILLAPVTAKLLAGWIIAGDPGTDPGPYLPDRFLK